MHRRAVAALAALVSVTGFALVGCGAAVADAGERSVTVREPDGTLLAHVPLPGGGFALSYRNSVYGTLAEERYRTAPDGTFRVVTLAAEQLAVLEEYYAVPGPARRASEPGAPAWLAEPGSSTVLDELAVAATELGERTLHVPGSPPVPLPPLVTTDPTVVLDIEEI